MSCTLAFMDRVISHEHAAGADEVCIDKYAALPVNLRISAVFSMEGRPTIYGHRNRDGGAGGQSGRVDQTQAT